MLSVLFNLFIYLFLSYNIVSSSALFNLFIYLFLSYNIVSSSACTRGSSSDCPLRFGVPADVSITNLQNYFDSYTSSNSLYIQVVNTNTIEHLMDNEVDIIDIEGSLASLAYKKYNTRILAAEIVNYDESTNYLLKALVKSSSNLLYI